MSYPRDCRKTKEAKETDGANFFSHVFRVRAAYLATNACECYHRYRQQIFHTYVGLYA